MYRNQKTKDMIDEKRVPKNTVTRDIRQLAEPTGNIYESVVILAKRANQLAAIEKKEIVKSLEALKDIEHDTMDEVFNNAEQADVSKKFERRPKPSLVAIEEFKAGEIEFRKAHSDEI